VMLRVSIFPNDGSRVGTRLANIGGEEMKSFKVKRSKKSNADSESDSK